MDIKKLPLAVASVSLSLTAISAMAVQIDGPSIFNDSKTSASFQGLCTGVTFPTKIKEGKSAPIIQDSAASQGVCTDLEYTVGKSTCIFDYDKSNKTFAVLPGACRTPGDNAMLELYTPPA